MSFFRSTTRPWRTAPSDEAGRNESTTPGVRLRSSRAWLKALVRIGVSTAIILLLLWKVSPSEVLSSLTRIHLSFIPLAWAYYLGCLSLSAYRWQLFLNVKQIKVPLRKLISLYFVGMFLNHFMPGAVGGDVVKVYYLYRYTGQGKYSVISVFLERLTGLIGLSLISVAALWLVASQLRSPMVLAAVWGTAIFLLLATLALFCRPLVEAILRFLRRLSGRSLGEGITQWYDALASYKDHPKTLCAAILLSVVLHLLLAGYYAMTASAMGIDVKVVHFVIFLPLVTLVTMVPISVGGLGIRESLMIVLFREVGVSAADILSICLTVHVLSMLLSLWGGFTLLVDRPQPAPVAPDHNG
jgi:glycosyltransferase 2 family protein